MKKLLITLLFFIFYLTFTTRSYAIENPLSTANNKIGIHILFPDELFDAAKLINANGGDWGYVTIPIQIGDRDLEKWQKFMDTALEQHVIPIIRLASEGDYFNKKVWEKPSLEDVVDFANFLDSLNWPTKNRYIIVFNETNRGDEWGGSVNPEEYAQLLSFAVSVFKSKSDNFFIISAGLDNAAPEECPDYMNEYTYYKKMDESVPGIFNQIDGISSHSYPNPGFMQPPALQTTKSISSFIYERSLIKSLRQNDIPVFITETGWNHPSIDDKMKAKYFQTALQSVWSDEGIVAVTPFLFKAGMGPFKGFSFLNEDGSKTEQYKSIESLEKIAGKPILAPYVLGSEKKLNTNVPEKNFSRSFFSLPVISLSQSTQDAFKWIMKL